MQRGASRGRCAPPRTLQVRPRQDVSESIHDSRNHAASARGGTRDANSRMRRRPGDGASRAQRQRSHWFHMAHVGQVVNSRRVGYGGLADREQTQVPRAKRRRALRPAPGVARGPQCPRRPRRASHLSQRVGRARASSGASTRRAVLAPRALHSRADWPRAGAGEIGGYMDY